MTITINPFVAGVLATIAAEVLLVLVAATVAAIKKKNGGRK